jgi:hypothetical protein
MALCEGAIVMLDELGAGDKGAFITRLVMMAQSAARDLHTAATS